MEKTKNAATVINISQKAYNDFAGRIRQIFIEQMNAPGIANDTLGLLDRYVRGEEVSIGSADRVVQIAFMMIQPEIDRAIARSKAARLRAAVRKMKRMKAACETPLPESIPEPPADEPALAVVPVKTEAGIIPDVPVEGEELKMPDVTLRMNRRERRKYERDLRIKQKRDRRRQCKSPVR